MITSNLEFLRSNVTFVDVDKDSLDVSKLDCGFFVLYLSSTIVIADNSNISNLKALN